MFLSLREILIKYKQTVVGILWAVLRPLLTMLIFNLVFNKIANLPSDKGINYAVMIFSGLLPWQFFSNSLTQSSVSLVQNTDIITKIYFPRIIIPVSVTVSLLLDFLISLGFLILMLVYFKVQITVSILFLPVLLCHLFMFSLACGLVLGALNVAYRDFRYVVPFLIQTGIYISPVGFTSNLVSKEYEFWFYLNPMAGIIDGFRHVIYGGNLNYYGYMYSVIVSAVLFVSAFRWFISMEKSFADVV